MSFYQLLFSRKLNGINRNLTWYWNLFAKYMRENVGTLLAKILKIKGNTIVWNQILYDGNFTNASNWATGSNASITVANNQIDAVPIDSGTAGSRFFRTNGTYPFNSTHTYLFFADAKGDTSFTFQITHSNPWGVFVTKEFSVSSSFGKVYGTFTPSESADCSIRFIFDSKTSLSVKNANIIDLTQLNDPNITDYDSFIKYYPLPYYSYDSGSLLSFNGTGIKTTGFNILPNSFEKGTFNSTTGEKMNASPEGSRWRSTDHFKMLGDRDYYFKMPKGYSTANANITVYTYDSGKNFIEMIENVGNKTKHISSSCSYANVMFYFVTPRQDAPEEVCVNADDSYKNGTYEPYKSSIKPLPVTTTSGLNIWDEITEKGGINTTDGQEYADNNVLRSANYIPVFPDKEYCFNSAQVSMVIYWYDINHGYISYKQFINPTSYSLATSPSNAYYLRIRLGQAYGTIYKNDICVSYSSSKNGTYEPYIPPFFPDGMLSAGSVYDELTPTSYVKRVGQLILNGNEGWAKETLQNWTKTYYILIQNETYGSEWDQYKIYCNCDKFTPTPYRIDVSRSAGQVCITGTGRYVEFFSDLSTVDEWKAYLQQNPVTLYYELASPLENYGVVDLGSLTWYYNSTAGHQYFRTNGIQDLVKTPDDNYGVANLTCSKYVSGPYANIYNNTADKTVGIQVTPSASKGMLTIEDSSYSDPDVFKSAMSGVYLLYELETPATIDLDLSYEIEWGGTEQLLPSNTSTPTTSPISATVEYPDGEHEDYYTYQEIEKNHLRLNRALSIMLGRNVIIENPQEPLDIIMRGE